jgi:adenylate kinase family enzyme
MADVEKQRSVLLVGPTGSGKTPVGELLQEQGLGSVRFCHLDFGACLRSAAAGTENEFHLSPQQRAVVRDSLRTGALLEQENFEVFRKVVTAVVRRARLSHRDLLLLNGFPRHVGQAEAAAELVSMRQVIHLGCTAEVVLRRIADDAGGDRAGRDDDSLARIESRLRIYEERTLPLLDYYRGRDVPVAEVRIGADTLPTRAAAEIRRVLASR